MCSASLIVTPILATRPAAPGGGGQAARLLGRRELPPSPRSG
jgi:hypothetical protein